MKALILAAGYAVRLYPLTKVYPKPLLPVGGKPIIEYIIDKLEKIKGLNEVIIVTNTKFFPVFEKWARNLGSQKPITLIDDLTKNNKEKRGAIGDIEFVISKKRIKDDLLVIGGDNIFDASLKEFISFAKRKKPGSTIGIYNVKSKSRAKKFGVVTLNHNKKIIEFQEKPKRPHSTFIAMCLYYFPKNKLHLIKEYLAKPNSKVDEVGFYIDWLRKKDLLYGFVFGGVWYDVGQIDFYKDANKKFMKHRRIYGSA